MQEIDHDKLHREVDASLSKAERELQRARKLLDSARRAEAAIKKRNKP